MKRGKKLILLLLVLAVLSGAAVLVQKLNPDTSADDASGETGTAIFTLDPDSVAAISWKYLSQSCSFERDGDNWVYTQDSSFPLNYDYIDTMLNALAEIDSSKVIESPEDLSVYGLDDPHCTVTLTVDGKEKTLLLGDDTSSVDNADAEQYLSVGDGKVYLVSTDLEENFNYGLYDLVQKESIPNMSKFVRLCAETTAQDYEIDYLEDSGLAYSDEYTWFLKNGDSYTAIDTDLADTFVDNIRYLVWGDCADYNATEKELTVYGFDSPTAVITLTYQEGTSVDTGMTASDGLAITTTEYEDKTFNLEIGKAYNDSAYYARLAGSNMVYFLTSTLVNTMLNTTYADLAPDEIVIMDWDNVSSVDVALAGNTYTFIPKAEITQDDDGNSVTELHWYYNGDEVSFSDVTDAIDKLYFSGYALGMAPDQEAEIGFTFHQSNKNWPTVEIVFYPYDSEDCMETLNGESCLLVPRDKIASLEELITDLVSDDN